ncbi:MAG: energy transducer TonB [Saprospiraceae bacterium]
MSTHKQKKAKHFIRKPAYPGGLTALRQFIVENLQYPPLALAQKIEGTVYLSYLLNYRGNVLSTKVISSLGYGCDEEAERLVNLLKFKVPVNRGVKVKFRKSIQIHFRLDSATMPPQRSINLSNKYSYQFVPAEKKLRAPSATYTIQLNIDRN